MIARFTRIDPNGRWLNVENLKQADDSEVSKVQIPPNLQPNYKSYFFEFVEESHTFVFESYGFDGSLSPNSVRKFLDALLNSEELVAQFRHVGVSLIQDREQLDYIWKFRQLRRLEIHIRQPNPDIPRGLSARISRRLQSMNVKELVESFDNKPGTSIQPDRQAKQLAEVATTNGFVVADGADQNGTSVQVSTADFPKTERVRYDPDTELPSQAFAKATALFLAPREQADE